MEIILVEKMKISRWDGGETLELYISPASASLKERNFDFRISSASFDVEESEFSDFTGYERIICPLEKNLKMFIKNKEVFLHSLEIYKFKGDEKVRAENEKNLRDFNLIYKEGMDMDMRIEKKIKFIPSFEYFIYTLAGVKIDGIEIEKNKFVRIEDEKFCEGLFILIEKRNNNK